MTYFTTTSDLTNEYRSAIVGGGTRDNDAREHLTDPEQAEEVTYWLEAHLDLAS